MTPAKLMRIANQAAAFNESADQFAKTGSNLSLQRDLLVEAFRDMGMLKDEAEEMCAKLQFKITMPEPDADEMAAAQSQQEPAQQDGEAEPAASDEQQGKAA